MNQKTLVILAILALFSIVALVSCAEPTPKVVEKVVEKIVEKPVEKVVEKPVTVIVQAPTPAPKPTEAPRPPAPTAKLEIGGTGLTNVPINMPVQLMSSGLDPKVPVTVTTWTLTVPAGSKVTLKPEERTQPKLTFTPDVVGRYKVDVVLSNASGNSPMASVQIFAGTIIGDNEKNCKTCHPSQTTLWTTTVHAKVPTSVQCEACHGPAKEHALNGAKVMASSLESVTCEVCHNPSAPYYKGTDLKNAKHVTGENFAYASGPARQACVRCHSGVGFISFLQNPTSMSAWNNSTSTIECATCHDPHSDKYPLQLRIAGKPVALPFEAPDVGLSAVCYECHNARTRPADAIRGSFAHYSSIAELMSNTGGVTYDQTVPNSPHGALVGNAPVPNPAAATDPKAAKFLFTAPGKEATKPGPCVVCHMWPGPTDTKDPNYQKVGAHSFNTVSPDGKFDYTASCKSCHGDIKDFNLKAKADYDGNGKVEGVKDELKGLLNAVWKALEAKGVKQSPGHPYWIPPRDAQGNVDDKLENAFYNYRTVYGVMWTAGADGKIIPGNEGASAAAHNFKRACALLQLSIRDVTGALPAGAADCTK